MEIRVVNDIGVESWFTLLSNGQESYSPDKSCVKVNRSRYILHFVKGGKGWLSYGNQKRAVLSR